MTKPERDYSNALWLIGFKMPLKMRFLFGDALPQANIKHTVNGWLHFSYALTEAPHTTKQLWKVTRFIAGMRAINDAIKVDEVDGRDIRYSDVSDHYKLDNLINCVPIVTIPAIMYPRRYQQAQHTGRKNTRKRVKAHYEGEYSRYMGLRAKRLHYEGLMTIHTVYAAALKLEEFVTARLNEHTNQPSKPDHKRALSSAVAFYHGSKQAAIDEQWRVKLQPAKRKEVYMGNAATARKVLKQKRDAATNVTIAQIKQAMTECVKPNGRPDTALIAKAAGIPLRTVQRHIKSIKAGEK